MPNWQGSDRRDTLPADWAQITVRILRRDFHRCQHIREDTGRRCLAQARDVDHIIPHSQGGGDDDGNLQSLCPYHHLRKSGREGGLASGRARRARRDAARPLHPGLMTDDEARAAARRTRGDDAAPF